MNWEKIKEHFGSKSIADLAVIFDVGYLSLQKAAKGERVLSARNRLKILKVLVDNFKSPEAAISWLEDEAEFFDVTPLQEKEEKYFVQTHFSYRRILSRLETPDYYVSRPADEKAVIEILSVKSQYRGVVVTGIGGAGKSTTVKSSVRQAVLKSDFSLYNDDVLWVNCENKVYSEILLSLSDECGVDHQQPVKNVELFVRKKLQEKAILLVLDGVDELEYVRPLLDLLNNKSKLIVSSRNVPSKAFLSELCFAHHKLSSSLSFAEIEILIKNITGISPQEKDRDAIWKLEKATGGLSLAWVILSSLILETQESWANLQNRFHFDMLESGTSSTKHNSVRASLLLSYDALHSKHKTAAILFSLLGLFNFPNIPLPLLRSIYAHLDSDSLEEDLAVLMRYGQVEVHTKGDVRFVAVHALVARYARDFTEEIRIDRLIYRSIRVRERTFGIFTQSKAKREDFDGVFLFTSDVLVTSNSDNPLDDAKVLALVSHESVIAFLPNTTFSEEQTRGLMGDLAEAFSVDNLTIEMFMLYLFNQHSAGIDLLAYNDICSLFSLYRFCENCGFLFLVKKRFEDSISFLRKAISETDFNGVEEKFDVFFTSFPGASQLEKKIPLLKKVYSSVNLSYIAVIHAFQIFVVDYQKNLIFELVDEEYLQDSISEMAVSLQKEIQKVEFEKMNEVFQILHQAGSRKSSSSNYPADKTRS